MTNNNGSASHCLGLILAGGQSSRMEGIEKSFINLGEFSLIERTIKRLHAQTPDIVISANSDPEQFSQFNVPIIKDTIKDFAGPLAGVLSAMRWTQTNKTSVKSVITVAVDTPFFPKDYTNAMFAAHKEDVRITIAKSNGRNHPVFAIWDINLADDLEKFLVNEGNRKVMMFAQRYNYVLQNFNDKSGIDPFFNINTYDNLTQAQAHL